MVMSQLADMQIKGIVGALPAACENLEDLADRFGAEFARRVAQATGIHSRRVACEQETLSSLAQPAVARLLHGLAWPAESVDVLIVATQTGDHILPSTACLLHQLLALGKHCAAYDVNLGCSGFIYGLWQAAALLTCSAARRAVIVAGDLTTRLIAADDRAVRPLFGDGVCAVALERTPGAPLMLFDLGSDGAGAPYLIARRAPAPQLFMDGTQVFAFTLREVPRSIETVLAAAHWQAAEVDHFVLHQANAMMIRHLGAKIGAKAAQLVLALENIGNTSSASIPLALISLLQSSDIMPHRLVLSGFGVGWSWGSVAMTLDRPLAVCAMVESGLSSDI